MKKRKGGLVPLIPILERMGACEMALYEIAKRKHRTFASLWADNDHELATDWHRWLAVHSGVISTAVILGGCGINNCGACKMQVEQGYRVLDVASLGPKVERALYDYAKREGLA